MVWHYARGKVIMLMTPGPVECSPRVLQALARPQIYHYYPGFVSFYEDTLEKLRRVYQTNYDVMIMHGEGVLGLEAAVANVINPGEKVLVCDSGPFGKWFSIYVSNYKGIAREVSVPYDEAMNVELVKEVLDTEHDIKALTAVHCETPTGILNPVDKICREAKKHGVITIVDAVSSLGGVDVRPDEWGIDICICASQKCISAPPGLTMLSISPDAWEAIEHRREPIRNSYLSLLDYREAWRERRFPFTPFTAEIFALNAALEDMLEEGLSNIHERHRIVAEHCRRGLKRIGLSLWPKREEYSSNTVTAFRIPERLDEARIVEKMVEEFGVLIGGGYKETKGKVLRIGHMGYQARITNITATLYALERVLQEL